MFKPLFLSVALLSGVAGMGTCVMAQGAPQKIAIKKVDMTSVQSGWRASKLVGATIYNDANDKIGTIDDLIVTSNDRVPYAIISVGGFLGIGDKLVAVGYDQLTMRSDNSFVLHGGTKEALKELPVFTYKK